MDSATYKLIETILYAWNSGKRTAGVFCDMTKAYDCFNHELLIKKLEFYDVSGDS